MFLAFNCLNKLHTNHINGSRSQTVNLMSERTPLLTDKDDDMSSWGSSYDSASHDEETLEDKLATHFQGKLLEDTQSNNGHHQLCVICSNAPKDCFFLPCGHCAACFTCGTRYLLRHSSPKFAFVGELRLVFINLMYRFLIGKKESEIQLAYNLNSST